MTIQGPVRLHISHGCGGVREEWFESEKDFLDRIPGWEHEGWNGYYETVEFPDILSVVNHRPYTVIDKTRVVDRVQW